MEDINGIDAIMKLRLNNYIHAPHLNIYILCPRHWFKQADDKSSNKPICDGHKYNSTPAQDVDSGEIEYVGNAVDTYSRRLYNRKILDFPKDTNMP